MGLDEGTLGGVGGVLVDCSSTMNMATLYNFVDISTRAINVRNWALFYSGKGRSVVANWYVIG